MNSINTNSDTLPGLYAMKKAIDVQSQGIMKMLESIAPSPQTNSVSGTDLTGLGKNLDIKA
ncbi:MAG: hypothetical protein PHO27_11720 [Sulfuricurvum sp.]|nr:hypothetical protein [Sulfuricurvum sp.]